MNKAGRYHAAAKLGDANISETEQSLNSDVQCLTQSFRRCVIARHLAGLGPYVTDPTGHSSRPRFPERLQTRLLQVLRAHRNAKLAVSLEVEKKRFRKCGDVGRVFYVDQEDPATHAILLSKVSDLRMDAFQDTSNNLAYLPRSDEGVEGFMREFDRQ